MRSNKLWKERYKRETSVPCPLFTVKETVLVKLQESSSSVISGRISERKRRRVFLITISVSPVLEVTKKGVRYTYPGEIDRFLHITVYKDIRWRSWNLTYAERTGSCCFHTFRTEESRVPYLFQFSCTSKGVYPVNRKDISHLVSSGVLTRRWYSFRNTINVSSSSIYHTRKGTSYIVI